VSALQQAPSIDKVEPMYLSWTGPTRRRLRISIAAPGVVEGVLFLGQGKRLLLILLRRHETPDLAELAKDLTKAVRQFGIEVQTHGGSNMTHDRDGEQPPATRRDVSADEGWAWCLAIYEQVAQFKKVEEEEMELELRLEELREQKRTIRGAAAQHLAMQTNPLKGSCGRMTEPMEVS
jgi:Sec-independent protein translocase protein TatA